MTLTSLLHRSDLERVVGVGAEHRANMCRDPDFGPHLLIASPGFGVAVATLTTHWPPGWALLSARSGTAASGREMPAPL